MVDHIDHLETHRPTVLGSCYRMLGSVVDAEDATQESMIRAWKSIDRFDGRASLKTWLYRIATNVCLDELSHRGRRARPFKEGEPSSGTPSVEALAQPPVALAGAGSGATGRRFRRVPQWTNFAPTRSRQRAQPLVPRKYPVSEVP
jgi:RNA polymerase sigma factor (sigma-70 family)